ncbi:MAG: hypothetical protein OD814_000337 [Candidatus Alkanophagales archaeon MCA70_species_1]|nr:hypothetical protein [Candidatus Alkanophaga volatiphilum]
MKTAGVRSLGTETVAVKDTPGFVISRITPAVLCETARLLEGSVMASFEQVEANSIDGGKTPCRETGTKRRDPTARIPPGGWAGKGFYGHKERKKGSR